MSLIYFKCVSVWFYESQHLHNTTKLKYFGPPNSAILFSCEIVYASADWNDEG